MAFVAWVMRTMLSLYCAHYLSVNTQKIHKETISLQTTFSIQKAVLHVRNSGEGEAIVVFSAPNDCKGQLTVMDISGKTVQRMELGLIIAGMTYYQPLKVAKGMHIVMLQAGESSMQTKFVIP